MHNAAICHKIGCWRSKHAHARSAKYCHAVSHSVCDTAEGVVGCTLDQSRGLSPFRSSADREAERDRQTEREREREQYRLYIANTVQASRLHTVTLLARPAHAVSGL